MKGRDGFHFQIIRSFAELAGLVEPWEQLFRAAACTNPFAAPGWPITWARHFVPQSQLLVVAVWERDELVAVAPLWLRPAAPGVTILRLLGAGHAQPIIEVPQLLVAPARRRAVLRALLHMLSKSPVRWSWFELQLAPDHGWLEPQWLPDDQRERFALIQKGTRPCVIADLPDTWDALHGALKRNVRESIRRAEKRLARAGGGAAVVSVCEPGERLTAATRRLIELNHARARMSGRVHHPSPIGSPTAAAFFEAAVASEAAQGRAEILCLDLDGITIAAVLVLRAIEASYLSTTGFDPRWWDLSPVTALTAAALRGAIERGEKSFNLSVGADVAKLRWSEQLSLFQDFYVVRDDAWTRAAFSVFGPARALALYYRETQRHRER